mgnify:CR=1 FL=1|jgi:hypothetical protein
MTDQPKEYYEKKPGFVVKSGIEEKISKKKIDYSVITDLGQGFMYTQDGNKYDNCDQVSYELSGCDPNKPVPDGVPAKIIRTQSGDIIIEAMTGDVIIRGNHVRIEAKDGNGEVTITSPKQVAVNAPIATIKGTNTTIYGAKSVDISGQAVDQAAGLPQARGSLVDLLQGLSLGKIFGVLTKFKKFLE